jgi:hypothetical protein
VGTVIAGVAPSSRPQSIPTPASKNRVILAERDKVKVLEFNPATFKFDVIWESASTGIPARVQGIGDIRLADIDGDGKNELVAIDPLGICVWGKHGKYPQYFNFDTAMVESSVSQILPIDIDGDSAVEFVTQGRWKSYGAGRQITVWKPLQNRLKKLSEISLNGDLSWSLASGDCDNDNLPELVSSSDLVNILKWIPRKGLVERTSFADVASLVDVIRIADADNDGLNEITASGSGGTFSIHKPRGLIHYPVSYQNEPFGNRGFPDTYTQGLLVADIDDNGKNEIVVGLTGKQAENVLVFEMLTGSSPRRPKFRKIFGMPEASSAIPGFVAGDADNDGRVEVMYNGRDVLKFSRDASNNLQCLTMATLSTTSSKAVIGPFQPTGLDVVPGSRAAIGSVEFDMPERTSATETGLIFSARTYKCWLSVTSGWKELKDVEISLDSRNREIRVEKRPVRVESIKPGEAWDNQKQPFVFKAEKVGSPTRFRMTATLTADGGFRVVRDVDELLYLFPELTFKSNTLAVSDEDDYKTLNVSYDLFLNNGGTAWPPKDAILKHKNFIVLDESNVSMTGSVDRKDDLQAFLENAGNFFVHGYGVIGGYDNPRYQTEQEFIAKYFRAKITKDFQGKKQITGSKGDVISDGMTIELQRNRYNQKSGVLEPSVGAIPIFYYPSGEVAGIRVDGKYKLVYVEFALRDIRSLETRKELIRRILAWFNGK